MKNGFLPFLASALAIGLAACATISPRKASTGAIGCAEGDIQISDDDRGMSTRTWKAECHGRRYFCSGTVGPPNHVSCTQDNSAVAEASPAGNPQVSSAAVPQPSPAVGPQTSPPSSPGCQYDTQCKGDGVCRDHECADPVSH